MELTHLQGLFVGLICGLGTQTFVLLFVTWRTDWEKQVLSNGTQNKLIFFV